MKSAQNEEWRDIAGYEGLYQISTKGRVKSLSRAIPTKGNSFRVSRERIMKCKKNERYATVQLQHKGKHKLVHRLVAEAFLECVDGKDHVNHIDGDRHNNCVENLEWCNQSENQLHAFRTGLQKPKPGLKYGEHNYSKPIDVFSVDGIKLHEFDSIRRCSDVLGLRYGSIRRVLTGERGKYHNLIFRYKNE